VRSYTQERMDVSRPESERLKRDVEGALQRALDPSDVLPMLHRLTRAAVPGSEESVFAHRQLAELLIERHPWRATIHARRVLAALPGDDRAWAVVAASQAMLGHYKFAISAYKRALDSAPDNPSYAHNLGHLLDVALGSPKEALTWLRSAYDGNKSSAEITASFAHALARAGDVAEAQRVLGGATRRGGSREHAALRRWIAQGAPPQKALPPLRAPMLTDWVKSDGHGAPSSRRGWSVTALEAALSRGLARLPVGPNQRGRAVALARDAARCWPSVQDVADLQSVAAAVAYAIVYVDHVPLTQAEVAGCFRVNASLLRARFKDLRLRLDLTPGDARYATLSRS
jgi:tetratricopeptide (TPR) repeat protein